MGQGQRQEWYGQGSRGPGIGVQSGGGGGKLGAYSSWRHKAQASYNRSGIYDHVTTLL